MGYYRFFIPGVSVIGYIDLAQSDLEKQLAGARKEGEPPEVFLALKNACNIQSVRGNRGQPGVVVMPICSPGEPFKIRKSEVGGFVAVDENTCNIIESEFRRIRAEQAGIKIVQGSNSLSTKQEIEGEMRRKRDGR